MSLRVGIIGTGAMGTNHFWRFQNKISGVKITAISDAFAEKAKDLIKPFPDIKFFADGNDLIKSDIVDAVVLTSASPTHEDYCLTALEAGKRVFCEKPLSISAAGAKKVVDAEMKFGKKMIQIGFNRHFDDAFRQLHDAVASGEIGKPLLAHCSHHVPFVFDGFQTENMVTEVAIHEIDIMSWLVNDYIVEAQMIYVKPSSISTDKLHTPLILQMKSSTGIVITADIFTKCEYGYDIQCEIVCETGVAKLPDLAKVTVRKGNIIGQEISSDGLGHFDQSYCTELQEWVDACSKDVHSGGPDAWDGYCAAVISDAALKSLDSKIPEKVNLTERPEFYK